MFNHQLNKLAKFILAFAVLAISSGVQKAQAGCHRYEAVGWFIDKQSGKRSADFHGKGQGCGNAISGFESFRSKGFSVRWDQCFEHAPSCTQPGALFVRTSHLSDIREAGKIRRFKHLLTTVYCVEQNDSSIEYCWKLSKYITATGAMIFP